MNRRHPRGRRADGPTALHQSLARVDALIEDGQLAEAMERLAALDQRDLDSPEVLRRVLNIAILSDNVWAILEAAEPLARQCPDDAEVALNLAIARLRTEQVALAQRDFAAFAARWPDHADAQQAREEAGDLAGLLDAIWADLGLDGPPDHGLLVRHEELQRLLDDGEWEQAAHMAEEALRAQPSFHAVRNNLSLARFELGRLDLATAAVREILAHSPQDLYALANLARYLVVAGRLDEAAATAERLRAVGVTEVEVALKQAEALSYLGDDQGVLAVFEGAQKLKNRDEEPEADALLHHLAAVASLRQGNTAAARRRWQKALELDPELEVADENLGDLDAPPDERHAPWPFEAESWLADTTIEELLRELGGEQQIGEEAVTRNVRRLLERRPEVAAVVPALLDRGDPFGRELALELVDVARTPELVAAAAAFAQGQRGPSELRLYAAQIAAQEGAVPPGKLRFWQGGAWHESVMLGVEIHDEPAPHALPAAAVDLQRDAANAMRSGDAAKAERLLRRALEQAPGDPSLLNNLGGALDALGRGGEAETIARRLVAEHPDYLFGRTNLVHYLLEEGKVDEAQALIDPLLKRQRMHQGEFGALAAAQVNILIVRGERDGARSWLAMWEQLDPDNPNIELFRARLKPARQGKGRKR
jgi:tetratricopeptide (TPR) repeat protein